MALALYRKYRPRTFAEVIGQEHVTEPLSQALRSGRLHHAYLFSGPRGCGKTSSARILARSLNCEQGPTPDPCGVCASCKSLTNDGAGSIDVIEIDAASHGGVDDARDLREKAFFAPASSRYKIYVIDEAHMVSSAGFNALLKLVEEPPDYVKFIFATTEPEKVLGTIRSRTHHYPFRLIPPAVLRPYLQQLTEAEGVHVDPTVLPLVVRAGGGSARDSLSVLDQLIAGAGPEGVSYARAVSLLGVTDAALIDEMCDALAAGDGAAAYQTIDRVAEAGHDPRRFASDLLERLRDLIILQQIPDAVTKGLIDGPADQLEQMGAQATRLGPATLSRCADIVHNGLVEMRGTTAPRLLLELITARMLLPGADDASGALLQRLERMERRLTLTADDVRPQHDAPQSSPAPSGSGGISAARAAAAAAGRRAPATGPAAQAGQATSDAGVSPSGGGAAAGSAAPVSVLPGGGAAGSVGPAPASPGAGGEPGSMLGEGLASGPVSAVPGSAPGGDFAEDSATPVSAMPGSATQVSAAPAYTQPVSPAPSGLADPGYVSPAPTSGFPGAADPVSAPAGSAPASPGQRRTPAARRPEPAGIMPDSPADSGSADPGPPGQLSAAAIREVWPEIMVAVGRKSKKIAALAQGATVRELEGQTVVLTFRFPAHAKMVAAEPALISDALYEALGGRWQIRCDVAGESGPSQGSSGPAPRGPRNGPASPAQSSAAQDGPAQNGSAGSSQNGPAGPAQGGPMGSAQGGPAGPVQRGPQGQRAGTPAAGAGTTRQREAASRAPASPAADDSDDWPEPARPGGPATAVDTPSAEPVPADDVEEWPEIARPGGVAAPAPETAPGLGYRDPSVGQSGQVGDQSFNSPGGGQGFGVSDRGRGDTAAGPASAGTSNTSNAEHPAARNAAPAAPQAAAGGVGRPASSGLAAARAAAAGAGRGGSPAAPAGKTSAWSDGSPTEEAPYDPEYDGPVRPGDAVPVRAASAPQGHNGGSAFEGFDPGDEPLDDVIDEKTARQSSEQQAVQLLRDALGAEKISES